MNNSIEANLFSLHVIYYYFICMMKLIIKLLENDELLQHRVLSLN